MPQLQFDYGYMGDGGPLQIACFLVGADTSSGAIHATMVPDSKKMDMPCVVAATAKWCVTWSMNVSVYTKTKKEFFSCYWTKWRENVVLKDKIGKFYDKCHRQSHQSNGAAEKAVSTVRGLASTNLAVLKDKIPSFEVTTHSPMLPWAIRHAAWVLTRYNLGRDTRMTPYEKIRGQKYRKQNLPLGEQVLARRPGANVNQLLQPWVAGLWLGRDPLSDEHLIGTAAGVMRSRAVRRLQEPARWVPAASNAMLFIPWLPHLNLPGDRHTKSPLRLELCQDSSSSNHTESEVRDVRDNTK